MFLKLKKTQKKNSPLYYLLNKLSVPVIVCRKESKKGYMVLFTNQKFQIQAPDLSPESIGKNIFEIFPVLKQQNITEAIKFSLSKKTDRFININNLEIKPFGTYHSIEIAPFSNKVFAMMGAGNEPERNSENNTKPSLFSSKQKSEARKELQESEERYRKLFENNPSVILILDPSTGNVADANPAACKFYGYSHEEITSMNIIDINTLPKEVLLEKLHNSKNKQGAVYQFKHQKKNGDIRDVEVLTGPISIHRHIYVFSIVKDNTEEKAAKESLLNAKKKIEESDKLKSAFLSNMSHEIRTPMNAVLGFSELMEQYEFDREKQKDFLALIKSNANHLIDLIDSIIDMSKIETGQIKITPINLILNDFMGELHSLFQPQINDRKEIVFKLDIPENSDYISIFTDPIRLKQIFRNLLDNALKFTPKGSVRFGYILKDGNLIFFVKDTGIGVPPEQKEVIFERFRQLDQSLTRKYEGTGLGLAIVKNLIDLMNGRIWVESTPGAGSEFYFSLPVLNIKNSSYSSFDNKEVDLSGKTMLIVEDNDGNYEYLKEVLLQANAKVIRAIDGNTAIELCRHHPHINLVLMDFMLPGLNGDKVALEIRKIRNQLPIIAQTALRIKEVTAETDPETFSDIIEKPIVPHELIGKIHLLLK